MNAFREFLAATAGSSGGLIYAIGGIDPGGQGLLRSVEVYNPLTDTWFDAASMDTPRMGLAAATGSDGTIYAFGGNNSESTHLDTVEAYNPGSDTWSPIAPMPTGRRDLAAAAIDNRIFAIGGHSDVAALRTVEAYSP